MKAIEMKTRLENVIEQVKQARVGESRPWIFDENGRIKEKVMCCEVLDMLDELKDYEIDVADEWIEDFKYNPDVKGGNTYNWNANISNDLNFDYVESQDGEVTMLIMVHLYGDVRGGYSDYFAVKFDSMYEFYELESASQSKNINESMVADMSAFSEGYEVYDWEKQDEIGRYYELEVEDLLEEIKRDNQ